MKKFLFNYNQLATCFGMNRATVERRLKNIPHHSKIGRIKFFMIGDVAELKESRDKQKVLAQTNKAYHPNSTDIEPSDDIETDPTKMSPIGRINYYKAEDLKQASILKGYKNDLESGKLMEAIEVEPTIAEAFKKIALVMDTLPDLLERDGIIGSADVESVINIMDKSRQQLAIDLSEISPETKKFNDENY